MIELMRRCGQAACGVLALAALAGEAPGAPAEAYPRQPVRLVVPYAAGAQVDTIARLVSTRLADALGQPVVVDNRPGASGNIAFEAVAKAAPDGHTLLIAGQTLTMLPSVMGSRAVDPAKAFTAVTKVCTMPMVFAVNAALGINTLGELIARARSEPGRIAYTTGGSGSSPHLAAALLWSRAGVELTHVPYSNAVRGVTDVLTGEASVSASVLGAWLPYVNDPRAKLLAVGSAKRSPLVPGVPTVEESGFPGYEMSAWIGIFVPAGTPSAVTARLQREIAAIVRQPDVRERLTAMGTEPIGGASETFAAEIRSELVGWPAIVRAAGIQPE